MEWMIQGAQLVLSLSILIILHELGHFIPARIFHTRVEKFYLFFDPWFSLFKTKKGDTEYGIGWLPLGGYVKISGMIDESMDKEQMKQPPQPWEFRSKPAWQRLIIMVGGVTVNIILAMMIYAGTMFYYGEKFLPNENIKDGIWAIGDVAESIGLKNGDKIVSIDGEVPEKYRDLSAEIIVGSEIVINRNGENQTLVVPENIFEQLIEENKRSPIIYPRIPFIVSEIPKESHNKDVGLGLGDKVISVNGTAIKYADEFEAYANDHKSSQVTLVVEKDDKRREVAVNINEDGKIGVIKHLPTILDMEKLGTYELKTNHYSFFAAFPAGINKALDKMSSYVKQLKKIFNPSTGAWRGLSGFGGIASLFPAEWEWQSFWDLTAFLSIILAVMNILPIPALDGGHVMFLLYEMVTNRKPNEKVLEYAQIAGFVIVLALVLYANINDIINFNK